MKKIEKRFQGFVRPTITLTEEENKLIEHFRIDMGMSKGEFIKKAALYCVKNKINPNQ